MEEADFAHERFDEVFAVNARSLWDQPRELDIVRSWLAPGGKLALFHQEPGWGGGGRPREFADRLRQILEEHAYSVSDVVTGPPGPAPTVGVLAQSSSRR